MLKGYGSHAAGLGYRKEAAVPLTQPERHTLLTSMHEMLSDMTDTAEQLLVVRDGLLFSILWQTRCRSFNAGG